MIRPVAYEGKEPYIFISYAHKDSDRILPIISALQERGFRVWYDAGIEAGTEWPEYIAEHLENCGVFLAFLSQAALESPNCRQEINFAVEERKEQLIVYLEDVRLTAGMRMRLGALQAMYRERHSSQDSFLDELCRSRVLSVCRGAAAPKSTTTNSSRIDAADACRRGDACFDRQEYKEAVSWYRKSANLGYAEAQCKLGRCYEEGLGFSRADVVEAEKWYKKAAEQGNLGRQLWLARYHSAGLVGSKGGREAVKWYRKAAEQGSVEAQNCLGNGYYYGFYGLSKDETEAVKWYRMAAAQGSSQARLQLSKLGLSW